MKIPRLFTELWGLFIWVKNFRFTDEQGKDSTDSFGNRVTGEQGNRRTGEQGNKETGKRGNKGTLHINLSQNKKKQEFI